MDKGNKLDFSGQHIYVGMDVHKKSWSVSIYTSSLNIRPLPNLRRSAN
jgi:hypothetical protein